MKWSKTEFLFFFFSKNSRVFRLEGRAKTPKRGSAGAGTYPKRRDTCVLTRSFCFDDKLHIRAPKVAQAQNRSKNSMVRKICIYARKAVPLQANSKTAYIMKKQEIKFDKRNYRKHNDENKRVIKKSLEELGAGRSIVIDNEGEIIAGNGVYEQAQALQMPVRVVETDGSELVVVKRTDIHTQDEKRRKLALADNAASDLSEWDVPLIETDWAKDMLADWGVELPEVGEQKTPTNSELDIDSFDEEQTLKLKFKPEQYSFVLTKLREYGDDFSASLLLILGYKPDDYE